MELPAACPDLRPQGVVVDVHGAQTVLLGCIYFAERAAVEGLRSGGEER